MTPRTQLLQWKTFLRSQPTLQKTVQKGGRSPPRCHNCDLTVGTRGARGCNLPPPLDYDWNKGKALTLKSSTGLFIFQEVVKNWIFVFLLKHFIDWKASVVCLNSFERMLDFSLPYFQAFLRPCNSDWAVLKDQANVFTKRLSRVATGSKLMVEFRGFIKNLIRNCWFFIILLKSNSNSIFHYCLTWNKIKMYKLLIRHVTLSHLFSF